MNYCLDTNICIYFLKGLYPALLKNITERSPDQLKIASIVKAELLYGANKSHKKEENTDKVETFLLPFEIIPFDRQAAEIYARVRSSLEKRGTSIGPNDLIIAATVLAHNGTLITNNVQEFSRVPELPLENWTT